MRNPWRRVALSLFCGGVSILGGFPAAGKTAAPSPDPQLVLVENGNALAPIVIFKDAPPMTRQAADELAEYIEKISGAKPEVIEGRPDPLPEHAIWVGHQPILKELFPNTDLDFQHPEEILITANESHLLIAGRDVWDPEHLTVTQGRYTIEGVQQEYGTHNAVYTFLQDDLDVRWFWPGPFGEDIPRRDTLAFAPFEYRYHPQFRGRASLFRRSRSRVSRGHAIEWSRRQRLLLDSLELHAGHAYTDWWERFHATNPEFFALQPDGTREPMSSPHHVKMCVSSPAFQAQWLKDVAAALDANPNQVMFSASPNDGGYSGFCVCSNCLAWDHPDGKPQLLMWQGLSQTYVSLTDRYVTLANTLARRLRKQYPGRDLLVGMYAYGAHLAPPVAAVPDDNVVIGVVASFHNNPSTFSSTLSQGDHRENFLAWAKVAPKILWRPNLGGMRRPFPTVDTDAAMDDLRLAADSGVIALDFDMFYEHWALQGPHYYMAARMAWNPYADGEAILDDYYRRAFGPAAGEIRAYWELAEEVARRYIFGQPRPEVTNTWDADFFHQAHGHLDGALAALDGAPEIYRERVGFVRAGFDYWEAMVEALLEMERFRADGGRDKAAEDRARAIWIERIRPLVLSEKYPTAINPSYARPGGNRSEFHPSDLNAKNWR